MDAGGSRLVLRRPPLGHVLPTAHDMTREFRVLTALHGTDVPVPAPLAICADPDVIGAPFYVMEYVDGLVLRTREDGEQLTPDQAAAAVRSGWPEMLAAIHGVDIDGRRAGRVRPARTGTWPASWPAGSGSGSCR